MSNQIVISSGAKVRSLEGVLTGTAGIVSSVPYGGANGVATLDSSGKVPLSQLPSSVITYLGTWNASTNTPTLTNGVGDDGDLYICNVAGTVNFGAGPITFAVGDWVIYGSGTWQKSAGASGTVTSVALTESGDALTITGSPITTSGTINIGFAGTSGQYINGAGNLTTFPSLTGYVPYTGATANVDLGTFDLTADVITGATGSFASNGGSDTFAINHSSGSGIALNITKGGNGEGLYINKTSGSGNAATIIGTLNATTLVKNGGTSSQYLMADGSVSTGPDLTGYVPYTGATTNVDLGSYNATALNFISTNGYAFDINASPFFSSNQSFLSSTDSKFYLTQNPSSTGALKSISLDITDLGTGSYSRNYKFPNINGTFALLEGTQTFTGAKTFSDNAIFSASPLFDQSANFKVGASLVGTGNYIAMAFDKSGSGSGSTLSMKLADGTTAKGIILNFVGSPATYTYTFPSTSGTIALTSDIPSLTGYVPYTGATSSVNLGSYALQSSGVITESFYQFKIMSTGIGYTAGYSYLSSTTGQVAISQSVSSGNLKTFTFDFSAWSTNTSYTYTLPAANGTLVLGTGTTNYISKWTASGVLGNSLIYDNGTQIGFGTATPNTAFNFVANYAGHLMSIQNNNSGYYSSIDVYDSTGAERIILGYGNASVTNALAGKAFLFTPSGVDMNFYTGGINQRMVITSTGNVGIGTSSPGDKLTIATGASTSAAVTFWANAGTSANELYVGQGSSNEAYVFNRANQHLVLGTNNTERMRITSAGNVGINGSDSGARLYVKSATSDNSSFILFLANTSTGVFYVRSDGFVNTGTSAVSPYNNTSGAAANLVVTASGGLERSTSSLKYKKEVRDYDKGLAEVMGMRPVYYKGKNPNDGDKQFAGLIAEEIDALGLNEFVTYADDGSPDALAYQNMIALLTKAIQEQQKQIDELKQLVK
jgi:hypothetical protein